MKIIIRNDDVSASTTLDEIHTFCKICDKYDVKIIQAITPIGNDLPMESSWANEYIKSVISEVQFSDNREVISYLLSRNDLIGTHGLIHSHRPTKLEQEKAKNLLQYWGFKPEYAILPFNEESPEYSGEVHGMKVLGKSERQKKFFIFILGGFFRAINLIIHGQN